MLTEEIRVEQEKKSSNEEKVFLHDIIKAAAVYERLEVNPDWITLKEHLAGVAKVHTEQIAGYLQMMSGVSFFKRLRFLDIIMTHQIRLEQINEALSYPKRIVHEALLARETLDVIKEKEKQDHD